jgi:hypothetical protein
VSYSKAKTDLVAILLQNKQSDMNKTVDKKLIYKNITKSYKTGLTLGVKRVTIKTREDYSQGRPDASASFFHDAVPLLRSQETVISGPQKLLVAKSSHLFCGGFLFGVVFVCVVGVVLGWGRIV